jgi:hypothetical protein
MKLTNQFRLGRISLFRFPLNGQKWFRHAVGALALLAASAHGAMAATTITGTVQSEGKYLVSGAPVATTTPAVLKLSFQNNTPGTNLELCAGAGSDFISGACPIRLSDSGGPGFVFLTIVDTPALSGKVIYVIRAVGIAPATFQLTVE